MRRYLEPLIIFLLAILGSMLMLVTWSYLFTGDTLHVSVQDELPNALIFSAVLSSLVLVWRKAPKGRAARLLLIGLSLIALEVFLEMPFKKFAFVDPVAAADIRQWFFFFGLSEFIGILFVFSGTALFLKKLGEKS